MRTYLFRFVFIPMLFLLFPLAIWGQESLKEELLFETNQFTLTQAHQAQIGTLIPGGKRLPYTPTRVIVSGHTDELGSKEFNLDLSQKRANSVIEYLTELGITAESVQIEAWGEDQPTASNKAEPGRSLNRRVTIEIEYENPVSTLQLEDVFAALRAPSQHFKVNPKTDNFCKTAGGTTFFIPKGSFDTKSNSLIDLYVDEARKKSDLVRWYLTTLSGDDMLASGGMYHLRASQNDQEVILKKPILLINPTTEANEEANLYYGDRQDNHTMDWLDYDNPPEGGIANLKKKRMRVWRSTDIRGWGSFGTTYRNGPPALSDCRLFFCRLGTIVSKRARMVRKMDENRFDEEMAQYKEMEKLRNSMLGTMRTSTGDFDWDKVADNLSKGIKPQAKGDAAAIQRSNTSEIEVKDESNNVDYYVAALQSLGWNNTDWLSKFPANETGPVSVVSPGNDVKNTRIMLLFKRQNTLLPSRLSTSGNYVIEGIPRNIPFWLVGLRVENGKMLMAMEEHKLKGNETFELRFEEKKNLKGINASLNVLDKEPGVSVID